MERYRVKPGSPIDLSQWDPSDKSAFGGSKREAREALLALNKRLEALQELLYAEHKHKVLVVLQAMDTGGKDGTIRHVFEGVNPQGVKVAGFKVPTPEELDHDYLWRVHKQVPEGGARSSSLIAATMRTFWWFGCIAWCHRKYGASDTPISTTSSGRWPTRARRS